MGKLFGTDGVRGIVNQELTYDLAYKIGKAGGYVLSKGSSTNPIVLIAKDTRASCDMLEEALTKGILSAGGYVLPLGVLPTPGVSYLVRKYNATAGIMISASHNPAEYNGIKFFDSNGQKLTDETEEQIEAFVFREDLLPPPLPKDKGTLLPIIRPQNEYADFLRSKLKNKLSNLKLAIDCANGAATAVVKQVFSDLGAEISVIANQPNGTNINQGCGSTDMKALCRYTVENRLDLGIAFDGDADRVLLCDEKGAVIDGDQLLAILALHLKKQNNLPKNTLVATVMSNLSLSLFCEENNINFIQTKVGDRYVLEEMIKNGYALGGEQSGHIILLQENTTGDGILTALMILNIMAETKKSASELAGFIKPLPQILLNVTVQKEKKEQVLSDPDIADLTQSISNQLGKSGRVLLRASGTEPVFRVMLEGKSKEEITQYAHRIADMIAKKFG